MLTVRRSLGPMSAAVLAGACLLPAAALAAKSPMCRSRPLAAVYTPKRLLVRNACQVATGTVTWKKHEPDGDWHLRMKPDKPYGGLINAKDIHGELVLEIIPADQDRIGVPAIGEHIEVAGAYNLDRDHGWMEIHPVWYVRDLRTGMVQTSPPPTRCEEENQKNPTVCLTEPLTPAPQGTM